MKDEIVKKAIELSELVMEVDGINQMLDDFSTEVLIEWSPKIREKEKKINLLAQEILEMTKSDEH